MPGAARGSSVIRSRTRPHLHRYNERETDVKRRLNLTGRTGRWSAERPWRAIGLWLAFVLVAVIAGGAVGTMKLHDGDQTVGESARATQTIAGAFPKHSSENILFRAKTKVADDPAYRAA